MNHRRCTLRPEAGPTRLSCPYCGLYSDKPTVSLALRALSMHARRIHTGAYALERWCNGPTHDRPVLLPRDRFHGRGRPGDGTRECSECERAIYRGNENLGYVPAASVRPFAVRLHHHYGSGIHRDIPVSSGAFYNILNGKTPKVRRATAARIISAAVHIQAVRHGLSAHEVLRSADCSEPSCPLEATTAGRCSFHTRVFARAR